MANRLRVDMLKEMMLLENLEGMREVERGRRGNDQR
jgi:hypothetical protein